MKTQPSIAHEWVAIDSKHLIFLHYIGKWTWEEHDLYIDKAIQFINDAQKPAFIAFNLRENSYMPPGGFAVHMRYTLQVFSAISLLQGIIYIMVKSPLKALITTAYNTYAPEVPIYFAHSIEEAADIVKNR